MRFFFCYSSRLHKALQSNGFRYICAGINERSGEKFWLYVGDEALNDFKDNVYQQVRDEF